MNKKHLLILTGFLIIALLSACASTDTVETVPDTVGEEATIEYIDIFDNQIRIKLSQPSEYIIYKPGDPFKVIVGLPGVNPGPYQDKIVSDKLGITEINPVLITEPNISTKLEILLQNPSQLVPEMSDNLLVLTVTEDDEIVMTDEEVAEVQEMDQVEMEEVIIDEEVSAQEEPVEVAILEEVVETPEELPVEEVAVIEAEEEEAAEPAVVTDIKFERAKDAVKVIIEADQDIKPNVLPLEGKIVLDFENVEMQAEVPEEVVYPLKGIRWGKHDGKTRIVLDLMGEATYDVVAINKKIVVSLSAPDLAMQISEGEAGPELVESSKETTVEMEEPVVESAAEVQTIQEGVFSGKRISLDFQDADIVPIFRLFADVSGYNFVISPKVKGKITMKLVNVPWDQALDLVVRTHSLGSQIEGNIIRIAPQKDLQKESEEKAKAKAALIKAKPLSTELFTVNYVGVKRMSEAIKKSKVISARGSMTLDERASVIIINDVEDTFPMVKDLIGKLDKPELQVRQVMIEARIVEANTSFARDLGIQWGAFGNTTDGQFAMGGTGQVGGPGFTGNNFIVNMPAGIQQGAGTALGLGYLNAARTLALDLQLSALERTGKGKVVSNPRIITMNNTSAKITQGRTIYVPVATADKTDVKAIDANLTLDVIPSIAPGGAILLKIKIQKDEPGDIVAGNISVNKNNAETTTLINSGDTVVIGGIYKKSILTSDDGVPYLSKIPLIGLLFKHKSVSEDTSEILFFITPRIVKYDLPNKEKL
ncbi:MAG: type IV pilus secretin PilQ [Thermodesulfovibrionales bacterium]